MNIILKIAKNELRNLFYSPIAWFLAFIFMIMCAYYYTGSIYDWSKSNNFFENRPDMEYWVTESVTQAVYWFPGGGFFFMILSNVYLFIPLLTMGVISREFNAGTARLLYSSPVGLGSIILGKYLAIIIYNLVMIVIIGIFIVMGFVNLRALDYGPLLSALLGFYLLMCALTAIGIFMSSLTRYQIVSAISCFTLLFVLNIIGGIWQQYDFVRDLTYFVAITGRAEKMLMGMITSKDIIYFLIIIGLFISFTYLKLRADLTSRPWYKTAGLCLAVAIAGILTGYATSRPGWIAYFDTTERKVHTIHPRTQQILRKTSDAPLEITLYVNILGANGANGFPRARNAYLSGLWEQYQRFKPDIKFKYEYYYDVNDGTELFKKFPGKSLQQIAGLIARGAQVDSSLFQPPAEMRKKKDLRAENYALVMELKYKGRSSILRTFGDYVVWPNEQNISAALQRLVQAHIPKVYFITGELERSIYKHGEREYSGHTTLKESRGSLINTGFDVDTLNLALQNIPGDADILVLTDPRMALDTTVQHKIRRYVDGGGNMLVLGEPGKQSVLNPVLKPMGVELMSGQLVRPSYNETPDKIGIYFTYPSFWLAEEFFLRRFGRVWYHKIYTDSLTTVLPGIAGIDYKTDSGFTITPLLMTLPGTAWSKAGKLVTDSTAPVFSPGEGDVRLTSFPTAIQLVRQRGNKEQRIVVCGDADIASNFRLTQDYSHAEWTMSLYSWLSNNEFPVYPTLPYPRDNRMLASTASARIQKTIFVWIIPGMILLWSSILLIRRQRK